MMIGDQGVSQMRSMHGCTKLMLAIGDKKSRLDSKSRMVSPVLSSDRDRLKKTARTPSLWVNRNYNLYVFSAASQKNPYDNKKLLITRSAKLGVDLVRRTFLRTSRACSAQGARHVAKNQNGYEQLLVS